MDSRKTGLFIAKLRSEKGLTQRELADKVGVTDKAVSKWECGRGFPDIGILEILSKELDVSITELLNGERFTPEHRDEQSDSAVLSVLMYIRTMSRHTFAAVLSIFGAALMLSPLYAAGSWILVAFVVGIAMILAGVILIAVKKSPKRLKISKKAAEITSLFTLVGAIALEALPRGAACNFAIGPNETKRELFSYFSLTPFGFANFAPLITAVLTIGLAVWTVAMFFARHGKNALFITITVTAVISACPVLYGLKYVTGIGIAITALLGLSAFFRAISNSEST